MDEAIKFLSDLVRKLGKEAKVDLDLLNKEAGVGIVVTDEDIRAVINTIFEEQRAKIVE